ncbi:MAG TPA: excinuclease ABC subunit UvrC, partial [Verrucomicrobiota bacterium]|nr:excinuclease ABC subunit UvrC [Verrucomicrobiota bacterium]
VSFWQGRPDRANYRRFRMKTVTRQDDFACMAETIRRRYARLVTELPGGGEDGGLKMEDRPDAAAAPPASILHPPSSPAARPRLPDLILIDGGRGQLNAARAELEKLGLGHLPVLGLAKENEEIHLPDRPEPLRLGLDSGAVKLLQRVRDEAHRFANAFTAQLRLKKISESLRDEFPG